MTTSKTYTVQIWKDLQLQILNISYATLADMCIRDQEVSATLTWPSSVLNTCQRERKISAKEN